MAEATFYQLAETLSEEGRQLQAICRVIQKVYQVTGGAGVLCASAEAARTLDDLLWTFNQGSFIPHGLAPSDEPVCLATEVQALPQRRVLVLTVPTLPDDLAGFERVVDFILPDPEAVKAARRRYRALASRGYSLTLHPLPA